VKAGKNSNHGGELSFHGVARSGRELMLYEGNSMIAGYSAVQLGVSPCDSARRAGATFVRKPIINIMSNRKISS